jgi:hypothetical protein
MENRAIVELFTGQKDEIIDGLGRVLGEKLTDDLSTRGGKGGGVLLVGVDGHRGRGGILFGHSIFSVARIRT